ncbi:uncharacterized protein LAESUDRAFT_715119 [Laetiporus sulphureus 93-53]|uniref:NTF2-like protein n=1 Tax=Laetiporus sulphureus 93-53 TaxID=1314785 RepID=A0A165DK75_9APHY|nr:uncharacterized protein LAESUDRAFT_715119 [Laetiporus sulphureus 93-53]KZT05063.1 hypothetical protein LAESUDRAFT_715119 [Laetiporus sulphureus 93-53]
MSVLLGPGPVIIPLSAWAEDSISAIYKASSQSAFDSAFDEFLHKDAQITFNGKQLTRDQYREQLLEERVLEQSADISFTGAVEVPANKNDPVAAGSVGLFYKATVYKTIKVFGASASSTVNSSLNVVITDSKGEIANRKVLVLNQVLLDEANPVTPPHGVVKPA